MLTTWVQYVITAKDKKDEVTSALKSLRYIAIGNKAATLIIFVAESGISEGTVYLRTPTPQILHIH
jgi:hypothetical protein